MRIAVLTLEAAAAAAAVRRFVADHADDIALVGLSNPYGGRRGGMLRQGLRHLRRSGVRFLPYLAVNFVAPALAGTAWRRLGWAAGTQGTPLASLCAARGIACQTVADVNSPAFQTVLRESGAELIICFHFDQILHAETIAVARHGGINVHPGLLPLHRGPVPTLHAQLDPDPVWGVTVHQLITRIDAGAILAQARLALPSDITALGAAQALHMAALPLLDSVLARLAQGDMGTTQTPTLPYCGFPSRHMLRRLRRDGRRGVSWSDLLAALRLPV